MERPNSESSEFRRGVQLLSPRDVQHKITELLHRLKLDTTKNISSLILDIISIDEDKADGRTVQQFIQLVFRDFRGGSSASPSKYAKLCKIISANMSPRIKDESIRDENGKSMAGGSLFREYLLRCCQEEWECASQVAIITTPPFLSNNLDESSARDVVVSWKRGAQAAFVGELYKVGLLAENVRCPLPRMDGLFIITYLRRVKHAKRFFQIIEGCIQRLWDHEGFPHDSEVDRLCSLLRAAGASLDKSEKGSAIMDAYFTRITKLLERSVIKSETKKKLLVH